MRGFNEARADKRKRDGLYVPPSKAKTKPTPTDASRISFTQRRPAPPGARQGYKASMAHRGATPAWSDGKGPR
jgi:hypothetical protein